MVVASGGSSARQGQGPTGLVHHFSGLKQVERLEVGVKRLEVGVKRLEAKAMGETDSPADRYPIGGWS